MTKDERRKTKVKRSSLVVRLSSDLESCVPMYATHLGELQSIIVSANRCLDCVDPRCVNLCPEHVDVRAAMDFIVHRPGLRNAVWTQSETDAQRNARHRNVV